MGVNETDRAVLALNALENDLRDYKHHLQVALGFSLRQDETMHEFNVIAAEIRGVDYAINTLMMHRRNLKTEE